MKSKIKKEIKKTIQNRINYGIDGKFEKSSKILENLAKNRGLQRDIFLKPVTDGTTFWPNIEVGYYSWLL